MPVVGLVGPSWRVVASVKQLEVSEVTHQDETLTRVSALAYHIINEMIDLHLQCE